MTLPILWFCLIAFFWSGYFVLEGFDFGVGMLLPFLPRDEKERGEMFRSIGPVWDGNEVWLVVAGAGTFAAFPSWYATMFSGFYLALLLILFLLIVRVVSFEWRDKSDSARWRRVWMWANAGGSTGIALIWGIALANLIHGVPINSSGVYTGRNGFAFAMTAVGTLAAVATLFTGLYPRVMVSSSSFGNSLTVSNAASVHYTLVVVTVVALTVMPLVLLYQGWSYYVFRAR